MKDREVQIPKVVKAHRICELFPDNKNTLNLAAEDKENKQDTLKKEIVKREDKGRQQV